VRQRLEPSKASPSTGDRPAHPARPAARLRRRRTRCSPTSWSGADHAGGGLCTLLSPAALRLANATLRAGTVLRDTRWTGAPFLPGRRDLRQRPRLVSPRSGDRARGARTRFARLRAHHRESPWRPLGVAGALPRELFRSRAAARTWRSWAGCGSVDHAQRVPASTCHGRGRALQAKRERFARRPCSRLGGGGGDLTSPPSSTRGRRDRRRGPGDGGGLGRRRDGLA